jgi:hypothetical protein
LHFIAGYVLHEGVNALNTLTPNVNDNKSDDQQLVAKKNERPGSKLKQTAKSTLLYPSAEYLSLLLALTL